jgi:uncharacterized protein
MSRPQIEFPCDYPIKVIAEAEVGLVQTLMLIAKKHDPTIVEDKMKERESRNGNYRAVTIDFWATGEPQLKRLFEDLKGCAAVRLVL